VRLDDDPSAEDRVPRVLAAHDFEREPGKASDRGVALFGGVQQQGPVAAKAVRPELASFSTAVCKQAAGSCS